jgi:hypothetical protein
VVSQAAAFYLVMIWCGGEVIEIPWIGRVVAGSLRIGIVVHGFQAEVVEIRKRKAWTSVKESVGRKVVGFSGISGPKFRKTRLL